MSPDPRLEHFFAAIQRQDPEQVRQLLEAGISPNCEIEPGRSALTVAIHTGNEEIVHLLIESGADVNPAAPALVPNIQVHGGGIPDPFSEVLSQWDGPAEAQAFYQGLGEVLSAFSVEDEESDEDLDDLDDDEEEDKDLDDEDEDEDRSPLLAAIAQGDLATVKLLLSSGASPNARAWHETPPLVVAARRGHQQILQELIAAGADPNRGFDQLPLPVAAERGHLEVVRILLDAGAEVEGYEEDEWTALMGAARQGHLPVVQLLIERGADVNAWSEGDTPLLLAAQGGHRQVYDLLHPLVESEIQEIGDQEAEQEIAIALKRREREANTGVEKLIDAAFDGKLKQVQQLIDAGVDVNGFEKSGRTALSVAAQRGNLTIIQALLTLGADPNIPDETDEGDPASSPLMAAVSSFFNRRRSETINLLAEGGADVNYQDSSGQTALMYSLAFPEAVTALIEAGADLSLADRDGNTALMRARQLSASVGMCGQTIQILERASAEQSP